MTGRSRVFLALPYHGIVHPGSVRGAFRFASRQHDLRINERSCSLLAFAFNLLFANCLNTREADRLTHFAMLHADVEPQPWWLDTLLAEMEVHDADVVSAVVPLKADLGVTSTAVEEPGDPWTAHLRLTLRQAHALPPTFSAADLGYTDGRALLVNTGCWVMRLGPWAEEMCFTVRDRMMRAADGTFAPQVEPEDWAMSRWWASRGLKVMATTTVGVVHHGSATFASFPDWGVGEDPEAQGRLPV